VNSIFFSFVILGISTVSFANDSIVFPAKNGNVEFSHKKHQKVLKDCKLCHEKQTGVIQGLNRSTVHDFCLDCHEIEKEGPTKCDECH